MIYIIRHSEKLNFKHNDEWKKSQRYKKNPFDVPISKDGIKYAGECINDLLKDYDGAFSFIYSSPLTRCIETSIIFQNYIKLKYGIVVPIRIEYGLTELEYNIMNAYNFKKSCIKKHAFTHRQRVGGK